MRSLSLRSCANFAMTKKLPSLLSAVAWGLLGCLRSLTLPLMAESLPRIQALALLLPLRRSLMMKNTLTFPLGRRSIRSVMPKMSIVDRVLRPTLPLMARTTSSLLCRVH
eukprot:6604796-Heterocapsa_arctica.AAC.1